MSFESKEWQILIKDFQIDFSFRAKLLPIFRLAIDEFDKKSNGRWSLENYEIVVRVNDDESYAAVSFLPDPAYVVEGIPFEIADRGMYKYGKGINYIYCLESLALVKTTYMR